MSHSRYIMRDPGEGRFSKVAKCDLKDGRLYETDLFSDGYKRG
jgi:hypothetical protein